MPLLNHVIYFLFLYSDHLYFLESSFWIQQQLVCYWKSQDISSTCLPVSMFKVVTSDFLACGIQKVLLYIYIFFCIEAFILDFFFFSCVLTCFFGDWSKSLWKSVDTPAVRLLTPIPLGLLSPEITFFRTDIRFKGFYLEFYVPIKILGFYSNDFVRVWSFF